MTSTKLILFEGIPGSGKSTAASHLQRYLSGKGFSVNFWREGNFDHPADFEGVACLTETGYQSLLARYPRLTSRLQEQLHVQGADYLLWYRKLQHLHPQEIPQPLVEELSHYDVYDGLPVEEYCRLALQRWRDFQEAAEHSDEITILECCFLQNPLTVMLARHDVDPQLARRQILETATIIDRLDPLLIYLSPQNARAALECVRAERPKEWADFVTWYLTGQEYGRSRQLDGFEGVIHFYEMRQRLESQILGELSMRSRLVEYSGDEWVRCQDEIIAFVNSCIPA